MSTGTALAPVAELISDEQHMKNIAAEVEEAHQCVVNIAKMGRIAWVPLGRALVCIREKRGFIINGCQGWDEYLTKFMDGATSTGYRAASLIDALGRLPDAILLTIPLTNAVELARLPESKRFGKKMLELSSKLPCAEFREQVHALLPGAAKPEKETMFKVPHSLKGVVEKTLKIAKTVEELEKDEDALEAIMLAYQNAPCELETFTNLNNAQAASKMKKARKKK
jgi:hypothetical protein